MTLRSIALLLNIACAVAAHGQQTAYMEGSTAPPAEPRYFHILREIQLPAPSTTQACTLLDEDVFAHAAPALRDLRLYNAAHELPYAVTLSSAESALPERAQLFNLGEKSGSIVFDLEMPDRAYTDVELDLAAQDFIATAVVSGSYSATGPATRLGSVTLFDLTTQKLGRNTTLRLQETRFRFLHIALNAVAAPISATGSASKFRPSAVRGANVPPSRSGQTLYTIVAANEHIVQKGSETIAEFDVPAHVPVERIAFVIGSTQNFSRSVRITARDLGGNPLQQEPETAAGEILRVHMERSGSRIDEEKTTVDATLGSNLHSAEHVSVAIENGDDTPLPLTSVELQMRQRHLCFDPAGAASLALYYGDDAIASPIYDYARLFQQDAHAQAATLGPEQPNPQYSARKDTRPLTERYPDLLWILLLLIVLVLGGIAMRTMKRMV